MRIRQFNRHNCIALLSLLVGGTCGAQTTSTPPLPDDEAEQPSVLRRYSVELIVFEYRGEAANDNELFLPEELPEELPGIGDADGETTIEFGDATSAADPTAAEPDADPEEPDADPEGQDAEPEEPVIEVLDFDAIRLGFIDRDAYTMTDIYEHLERLDAYEPVLHSGWIQAAFERQVTPPIDLKTLGNVPTYMDGSLTLYLGRYLHLVVDLSLEETLAAGRDALPAARPSADDSWSGFGYDDAYDRRSGAIVYRLSENRIVADGDLRYFDHPKFGMLARITRLEDEQLEDQEGGNVTGRLRR